MKVPSLDDSEMGLVSGVVGSAVAAAAAGALFLAARRREARCCCFNLQESFCCCFNLRESFSPTGIWSPSMKVPSLDDSEMGLVSGGAGSAVAVTAAAAVAA